MFAHVTPSPAYPGLHAHEYAPALFAHIALISQGFVAHSSMSVQVTPSPV
jgi:hypothetical protein